MQTERRKNNVCRDKPPGAAVASLDTLLYYIKYVLIVNDLIDSESKVKGKTVSPLPSDNSFCYCHGPFLFLLFLHKSNIGQTMMIMGREFGDRKCLTITVSNCSGRSPRTFFFFFQAESHAIVQTGLTLSVIFPHLSQGPEIIGTQHGACLCVCLLACSAREQNQSLEHARKIL